MSLLTDSFACLTVLNAQDAAARLIKDASPRSTYEAQKFYEFLGTILFTTGIALRSHAYPDRITNATELSTTYEFACGRQFKCN